MAEKNKIDLRKITEEIPSHLEGVKPYIEEPEIVIKKAVKRSIIVGLISILITVAGIIFLSREIEKLSSELENKQNLIYNANKQSVLNSRLAGEWEQIEPNLDRIDFSLPSSNDLLGYVGYLEKIGQEASLQQNIKLQANTASKTASQNKTTTHKGGSITHTVDLKGNLTQFIQYINALEKMPYIVQVTNLNLSSNQGLQNEAMATVGIKLYTYE
jgi:hypothetical protein